MREAGTSRDRHHRQTLQVLQHGLENLLLTNTLTASRVVAPNTTPVVVTPPPQRGAVAQDQTTPLLLRRVQEILTR